MGYLANSVRKHLWSYVFILPMLILFIGFTVYPLLASARYTLYSWDGIGTPKDFVGLENYVHIANDPLFWNALKNTFIYTGLLVPIQITIAMALALILNNKYLKLRYLLRTVFFLPTVTSTAIVGVVVSLWITTAGNDVNSALTQVGIMEHPIDWLGNPILAMGVIVATGIWIGLGYPLVYFLAGLQTIDQELYDAARIDGADNFDMFRYVTFPLIRPVGIVVLLYTTIHGLRVFDIVQVMTRGGPYFATDVVGTYIYRHAFLSNSVGQGSSNVGLASAAGLVMGLIVAIISIIQIGVMRYGLAYRQRDQYHV